VEAGTESGADGARRESDDASVSTAAEDA